MNENNNQQSAPQPASGHLLPSAEKGDELPQPNPFRTRTWNLTQQAVLMKREPKKAERLQAEAVADGEHHAPYLNRTAFYRPHGF